MASSEEVDVFFAPTITLIGISAKTYLLEQLHSLQMTKPLIVTDKGIVQSGILKQLTDNLKNEGIEYIIYDGVIPNPTDENIAQGVEKYTTNHCNGLISIGGRSSHDCCKGIGIIVANGGTIQQYEGKDKISNPLPPFIAVNTTAGTASELTRFCIITDIVRKVRMTIVDWKITPSVTINAPLLMTGKPVSLTAATDMDTLTDAIEAYISTYVTPNTDAYAEKATTMIANLPMAVANGENFTARKNMAYAQYLTGMTFNSAGLDYVHTMAHQLDDFYDLPHGECNAFLLPEVKQYNLIANHLERFKCIAFLMGKPTKNLSVRDAAEQTIIAIKQLSRDGGIPTSLQH